MTRDQALRLASYYLDGHPADNPLVAPLQADLAGLPPLLVQAGTGDPLLPDARRLADTAASTASTSPWSSTPSAPTSSISSTRSFPRLPTPSRRSAPSPATDPRRVRTRLRLTPAPYLLHSPSPSSSRPS